MDPAFQSIKWPNLDTGPWVFIQLVIGSNLDVVAKYRPIYMNTQKAFP